MSSSFGYFRLSSIINRICVVIGCRYRLEAASFCDTCFNHEGRVLMAKGKRENMSDEEKEIDVESDEEGAENNEDTHFMSQADKRAHHNALERKRRDHIKDSFAHLRDSIPSLQGEKASRAQILNKATDYIQFMSRKNHSHQTDIDDLKRQNGILDQQVRALEKARNSGQLSIDATTALLTTTDNLLSSSPSTDGLLEGSLKQDPSSPLNNNAEITSDDEYSTRAKRRKRDV